MERIKVPREMGVDIYYIFIEEVHRGKKIGRLSIIQI
jgi:hypothetical protein